MLVLDPTRRDKHHTVTAAFRRDLASQTAKERAAWQQLVLCMGTTMGARIPKGFDAQAKALIDSVGREQVIARLEQWIPRPDSTCRLETAGSHLLRNLVWLMLVISRDTVACDPLVERLTRVEVTPAQLGKKIALACSVYFAQRPHAVGRKPLEALLALTETMEKSDYDSDGIRKIVAEYVARIDG